MAVTKKTTFNGNISVGTTGAAVTDLLVQVNVQLENDNVPANTRYAAAASVWNQLTAQEQANFQAIYVRLVTLAATVDPPIP